MYNTNVFYSDSCAELFGALAKAQGMMGRAFKDANNPAFRTKYTSLASVLEAILPAYNASGLCVLQHPVLAEDVIHMTTLITHESGQWMKSICSMPVAGKKDAHAVGSAISYLRRYTLASICGVIQSDDDGNDASGAASGAASASPSPVRAFTPRAAPPAARQMTDAEIAEAIAPIELDALKLYCEAHNKPAPADMPAHQQAQMLSWLKTVGAATIEQFLSQRLASLASHAAPIEAEEPKTRRARKSGGEA